MIKMRACCTRKRQDQSVAEVADDGEAQAKRPGAPCCLEANVYFGSDDAAFVTAPDRLIDGGYIAFKGRIAADGRPAMT
jgi:hypothetical protein